MEGINTWWKEIPGERYWLGVTGSDGKRAVLAAPRGPKHHVPSWTRPLISHVRDGDVVFHYDEAEQAIVAWSTPRGKVRERRLFWSRPELGAEGADVAPRPLDSWAIGLEDETPLDPFVSLARIARTQWDLFPQLRAFEDEVGEPLYYPFAMDSISESRLLPGYVFKLPAMFVGCFPPLADVAARMGWSGRSSMTSSAPVGGTASVAAAAASPGAAGASGFVLR
jgi:hypothetical protein